MNRREMLLKFLSGRSVAAERPDAVMPPMQVQSGETGESSTAVHFSWPPYDDAHPTNKFLFPQTNDWRIEKNTLKCFTRGKRLAVLATTCFLTGAESAVRATLVFRFGSKPSYTEEKAFAGLRFGFDGTEEKTSFFTAGVTEKGTLFLGETCNHHHIATTVLHEEIRLSLTVLRPASGGCFAKLRALDKAGNTMATLRSNLLEAQNGKGAVALVGCSHDEARTNEPFLVISRFELETESAKKECIAGGILPVGGSCATGSY